MHIFFLLQSCITVATERLKQKPLKPQSQLKIDLQRRNRKYFPIQDCQEMFRVTLDSPDLKQKYNNDSLA